MYKFRGRVYDSFTEYDCELHDLVRMHRKYLRNNTMKRFSELVKTMLLISLYVGNATAMIFQ